MGVESKLLALHSSESSEFATWALLPCGAHLQNPFKGNVPFKLIFSRSPPAPPPFAGFREPLPEERQAKGFSRKRSLPPTPPFCQVCYAEAGYGKSPSFLSLEAQWSYRTSALFTSTPTLPKYPFTCPTYEFWSPKARGSGKPTHFDLCTSFLAILWAILLEVGNLA